MNTRKQQVHTHLKIDNYFFDVFNWSKYFIVNKKYDVWAQVT